MAADATPTAPPSAAVVCVGTELVSGLRTDTNGPEVARALTNAGYAVGETRMLADDRKAIAAALASLVVEHDLVIVTGGLGPTHDDVTREAAAEALARALVRDAALEVSLRRAAERHGHARARESILRQADVIEGARVLRATVGTAPGLVVDTERATLVLLPGPPAEMRPMLAELLDQRARGTTPRVLRTAGATESDIQMLVQDALADTPGVALTVLASPGLVDVVLFDSGGGPEGLEPAVKAVTRALGDRIYGDGATTLAETVLALARQRGRTLAVAESCTGGLVAAALTDIAGSSDVFLGGAVAYANDAKGTLLGVAHDLITRYGAVSDETARAMAAGVRERLHADIAVAVTGVAGPGGGTPEKPVGTVWFAVAAAEGTTATVRHLFGDRAGVRTRATVHALDLLRRTLLSATPQVAGDAASGPAPENTRP
ncbi:MAG TPA: CinA family nicotinamide mononucleotide deamidase-related protein [Coriobacteriia bacterium]|nr:CinA family nicotinamide mononucleotide deamidase-related protein [Coriobacteriia bacterium]